MHLRSRRLLALAATAIALSATATTTAVAGGSTVTRGPVSELGDSGISGHAQMVRRASGTTFVTLTLQGLEPGATYRSHVHSAACVDGGGGHYQVTPGGSTLPPNEIHPGDGPFTPNRHGNASVNTTAGHIAGASAVSVVVHDARPEAGNAKVACADLS